MTDILSYRIPSQEAFHYRKVFYSCQRDQVESNEKWFRRIENCVDGCDFGRFTIFMLLDKFISGLNNDIIDRLRPTQTLTVAQLMTIANDDDTPPHDVQHNRNDSNANNSTRQCDDIGEKHTLGGNSYLDESTGWAKESSKHQTLSTELNQSKRTRTISKSLKESDTHLTIAIKGYEKNTNGEFVCLDCGKTYKTRCTYNLHKRLHTGKMHSCDVCGKQFTKRANVKLHMITHEKDGKVLECYICRIQFDGFTALRIHFARKHSAQQQFPCTVCSKFYSSPVNLNSHMKTHKGLSRTVKCPHCEKAFQHSGNLKTHILINHSDFMPFVCETCGHGMKTRQHLQDHMRKHTGEKPFECNECGKKLRTAEAYKNHMRTHTGERPYACKVCPKTFSQRSNLWQHMRMHLQDKPFACSVCSDRFMTRYHMNRHMKVHSDIEPKQKAKASEKCPQCDEMFGKRVDLQRHIEQSHKDYKPFVCETCGHSTHTANQLNDHMQTHSTGSPPASPSNHAKSSTAIDRSLVCDICSKTFTQRDAFEKHRQKDHQVPLFVCLVCQQNFQTAQQLKVHMHSHADSKPHKCSHCNKSFTKMSSMRQHMKRLHTSQSEVG